MSEWLHAYAPQRDISRFIFKSKMVTHKPGLDPTAHKLSGCLGGISQFSSVSVRWS